VLAADQSAARVRLQEVTIRNRMLWIGLGVVLLLVVVTAVVLPRYLVGCRPVPGVPSLLGR
jgi:hypothetical protein